MLEEASFRSYGNKLVRIAHLGEYFSLYNLRLLAFILSPAFTSSGNTSRPSEMMKSTSEVAEEVQ